MKRIESTADRVIRAAVGAGLAAVGLATGGTLAVIPYVLAGILLVTAAIEFCPLHKLGIDTCRMSKTCQ